MSHRRAAPSNYSSARCLRPRCSAITTKRARKFCADLGWNIPEFTRLAVTAEQIAAIDLADDPDNPGKVQAEAIPPDVLAEIIQEAIDDRLDEAAWQQVLARRGARQGGAARQVRRHLIVRVLLSRFTTWASVARKIASVSPSFWEATEAGSQHVLHEML